MKIIDQESEPGSHDRGLIDNDRDHLQLDWKMKFRAGGRGWLMAANAQSRLVEMRGQMALSFSSMWLLSALHLQAASRY